MLGSNLINSWQHKDILQPPDFQTCHFFHPGHTQELQLCIEGERRAMREEATSRCEAAAAAREGAAAAAGAAALADIEARYASQLAASEAGAEHLRAEIAELQAAFKAYQAQKANEIATLEERVVMLIGGVEGAVTAVPAHVLGQAAGLPGAGRAAAAASANSRKAAGRALWPAGATSATSTPANHRSTAARLGALAGAGAGRSAKRCANSTAKRGRAGAHGKAGGHRGGPSLWQDFEEGDDDALGLGAKDQGLAVASTAAAAAAAGITAGPVMGAAAAQVADTAVEDAAAAARREALFERLHRQRAEALLCAARKAVAGAKARLRLVARQLEAVRASTVSGEEHAKVVAELASCREALKATRAESGRRQKALQVTGNECGCVCVHVSVVHPGLPSLRTGYDYGQAHIQVFLVSPITEADLSDLPPANHSGAARCGEHLAAQGTHCRGGSM